MSKGAAQRNTSNEGTVLEEHAHDGLHVHDLCRRIMDTGVEELMGAWLAVEDYILPRDALNLSSPHASTFCSRTLSTTRLIHPPLTLRIQQCHGIAISSSTDTLPQILPALRTESFKHLTSPIPHNTLHKYICPCSMFTPVLCFTPFHRPSTKLI